jgi:hypothetical protein
MEAAAAEKLVRCKFEAVISSCAVPEAGIRTLRRLVSLESLCMARSRRGDPLLRIIRLHRAHRSL